MERPHLSSEEVRKAIEHRSPCRVPMMLHPWNPANTFGERASQVEEIQRQYPNDAYMVYPRMPAHWDEVDNPDHIQGYSWMNETPPPPSEEKVAHDASVAIKDWSQLDGILEAWPDKNQEAMYAAYTRESLEEQAQGRYTATHFAFCFYERLWSLRGMENILCDFYTHPEEVSRLMDALTEFYCAVISRAGKQLGVDAFYTTDDIGMQTGPMFSPAIFKGFFKPRYKKLIDTAHENGMHFWLHTCGDVTLFLDDFIELELDVIHPIQKYAMDEQEVASRFGGKVCFWAGMDVQQTLPRGTPEEVRAEVRFMIDTYDRPDGGCMITAGNAITADVSLDNLRALYDETYHYGVAHRS